ncbi:MAG: N-acetyltransferase [Deltaproteobacteria bacterium]|nr:MAG: N-acetyltransferase [Deltaproteobacteria bacterium]
MPNKDQNLEQLQIIPVSGSRLLRRFIDLPWTLYVDDPCWVPPLKFERKWHLSAKNPYFDHADFQAWIACRGKRVVGRISAQVDQLHLQRYNDATGFFGFLEAEDSQEVFHALFKTAEKWLRQQGMERIRGPFSLSINDECGLLVEGFDSPPPIMLGHALPYYGSRVEEQGFTKEQDLLAYRVAPETPQPRHLEMLIKRSGRQVKVRPMRRDSFNEDLEIIRDIFEDAWSDNWGFIPFTPAEFAELGKNLKLLVDVDFVRIAEVDGEPVGMMIAFPNLNEMIKDLNGRLLPFGWLKLLWRLKVTGAQSARVPLMGVKHRYQGSRLGVAIALMMISPIHMKARKEGIKEVDMSWILEQNYAMRKIIESVGSTLYKRYRIYQKELGTE